MTPLVLYPIPGIYLSGTVFNKAGNPVNGGYVRAFSIFLYFGLKLTG